MKLIKCRSAKHKGCVFLKQHGTDDFILKVYASVDTEEVANKIINALSTHNRTFKETI